MSKSRLKKQGEGMRNLAQNNRGGQEANPSKDRAFEPATKRGQQRKQ